MGSLPALALALSAPLIYGTWDLVRKKKINYLSILGLVNVSLTGSLAVFQMEGHWFWIKDAAFPFLIGTFVFASRWTKKPFIQTLILNPQVMNLDLIHTRIKEKSDEQSLVKVIQNSTLILSSSFFLSAILNFFLAQRIFVPIAQEIQGEQKSLVLNEQIAEMTKLTFPVIFLPSLVILAVLMYYLLGRIKKLTGLTMEEILPSK